MKKLSFLFVIVFSVSPCVFGLETPEQSVQIGVRGAVSTDEQLPTWLVGNRRGLYQTEQHQLTSELRWNYEQRFTPFWSLAGEFLIQGAISEDAALRLPIGFLAVEGGPFVLHGGRFPLMLGELPVPALSSGSMSVSLNAMAIPRITGRTAGFIPIPWLPNRVQTKFGLSHGWFEENRATASPLLHEKWLYLRFAEEGSFSIYGGLVHQVMWSGENQQGNTVPVDLENFWRVFLNRSGGSDASVSDQLNKVGNALGIWDLGFSVSLGSAVLSVYYHHYFELASSFNKWSNGLDGLRGASLEIDHGLFWVPSELLFESLYTAYQGGPYHDLGAFGEPETLLFGRQSYYQNSAYPSGWTYLDRVVGTPLILTSGEGSERRISSNRLEAYHFGFSGDIPRGLGYRFLWTGVAHRSPYTSKPLDIQGSTWQYDTLFEITFEKPFGVERLSGSLGFAHSFGDLNTLSYGLVTGLVVELF